MTIRLDDATIAQLRAADPARSTWVSANAGAGKTTVLIDRVARLLLAGTAPGKILCLTYTKAAASEMQNRLFKRLGGWVMLEDADLAKALSALREDGRVPDTGALAQARRLFALALETPGGLKIQTIHAFCDALLRRFPLEAGVAPGFSILDDRSEILLRETVLEELAEAAGQGQHTALDSFAAFATEARVADVIKKVCQNRAHYQTPVTRAEYVQAMGCNVEPSPADWLALLTCGVTKDELAHARAALVTGSDKDKIAGANLQWPEPGNEPDVCLVAWMDALLTGSLEPKSRRGFPSKDLADLHPDLGDLLDRLAANTSEAFRLSRIPPAIDEAMALHAFGQEFLQRYEARKQATGLLDYQDLITGSRRLLVQSNMAAWVLFKLDEGIDHVLVDEAQDTSPDQWEVIGALVDEFYAGASARELDRTLFVVGDEKQSIYSFQGAEPGAFSQKRQHYADQLDAAGCQLATAELVHSFRSAPPILSLVDAVFDQAGWDGLRSDSQAGRHVAFKTEMPGRVELWPYMHRPTKKSDREWDSLTDPATTSDPKRELARALADEIARRIAAGDRLPGHDRALRPGDILVLVQRRDELARALVGELKARGVPVAGQDRMVVSRELAVRDLLAVLRFLDTPQDDLSLAAALRSPIFGWSEEALFEIAHGREKTILWQALRQGGDAATAAILEDLRGQVDFARPFELLIRLLTRHGARARILARLGEEAEDAMDELLVQAIAYESTEAPSLTGFLRWVDADDVSVKRELDAGSDLVRVMTVHGAKGLEAPMVILPDTAPRNDHSSRDATGELDGLPIIPGNKLLAPRAILDEKQRRRRLEAEENRRLLYVAMTRAESLLMICGAGARKPDDMSWYGLVENGLNELPAKEEAAPVSDDAMRVLGADWVAGDGRAAAVSHGAQLPDWSMKPPAAAETAPNRINPSDLGGAHAVAGSLGDDEAVALARGDLVHALIERLAPLTATARKTAGQRWLDRTPTASMFTAEERAALLEEVRAVLDLPDIRDALSSGALLEAPFHADVPALGPGHVSGRIDLVHVSETRVWIADFKSNRVVPPDVTAVPEAILRQLGAYRAAMEVIYPRRMIETALIWTAAQQVMTVPRDHVMAALARAGTIS